MPFTTRRNRVISTGTPITAAKKGHEQHQPRKLSLSVQLSEPRHYQGGELQAQVQDGVAAAPKTHGAVIAFPSYLLHRVTPITAGVRKSLVLWSVGPEYR